MSNILEPGLIPVGDTGESLDTTVVTTSAGEGHREAVFIADPTDSEARQNVLSSNADVLQYAALVQLDRDRNTELLINILGELSTLNRRFEEAFKTKI